ncbi:MULTISPECIES: hypothetical protein [Streptomyces]|uniref:Uncharacterized protein n=1 Tax=Streptomyces xanthochromogenes TaxID=67384 RepID=A0ABQ3AIQ6_9ACTN|nr:MULTISPECIES: hypothetical protein [Streptomyces]MYV92397.1 hypothetical protein [Streptomyces sp. SID1034]GGY55213.1 hypothetical protein GCM10010326_57230 [Streptomyces xanthochromogenes]
MTVELHVATALLHDLDPARSPLPGREVARRPSPLDPRVTIVDLEAPDAPEGAALVDPIFRREGFRDIRITEIRWYDRDGYFIAPSIQLPPVVQLPPSIQLPPVVQLAPGVPLAA